MKQVENLMLDAARLTLGMPDDDWRVRLAYGAGSSSGSAPAHDYTQSVCYVTVNPYDDGYGKAHHIRYENGGPANLLTEVDEYTEEYAAIFSCYGKAAYEFGRSIRDGLYGAAAKRLFHKQKFHLVPGTPQLIQTRELFNSNWVNRCDFTAVFYSYARIERPNAMDWYERVNVNPRVSEPG
jgi:hypothetical protein